jgi:hypothetical protein
VKIDGAAHRSSLARTQQLVPASLAVLWRLSGCPARARDASRPPRWSAARELLPRCRAQAAAGPPHSGIAGLACSVTVNLMVLSVFGEFEAKREKLA